MRDHIKITISGPGATIATEIALVEAALREAGYPVAVIDDYPPQHDPLEPEVKQRALKGRTIIIHADHEPWGG